MDKLSVFKEISKKDSEKLMRKPKNELLLNEAVYVLQREMKDLKGRFSIIEKRKGGIIMEKVKYTGCSDDQIKWGGHDDPKDILKIGEIYEVAKREVHSWHTKVFLVGIKGNFNSVCFEPIK